MPLAIALCDDDPHARALLEQYASAWSAARGMAAELFCYDSAHALLFAYEGDARFDIALLDIKMPGMDGMMLAKTLRQSDAHMQILFITGAQEHMAEGYEVDAVHYLLKPVDKEKLFAALDRAAGRLHRAEPTLLFEVDGDQVRLAQREIYYVEAVARGIAIYTAAQSYVARLTLAKAEDLLEASLFVRCHRAFLVGLGHVRRVTRMDVELDDGRSVPLSRRLYGDTQQAFIRFYREDA